MADYAGEIPLPSRLSSLYVDYVLLTDERILVPAPSLSLGVRWNYDDSLRPAIEAHLGVRANRYRTLVRERHEPRDMFCGRAVRGHAVRGRARLSRRAHAAQQRWVPRARKDRFRRQR